MKPALGVAVVVLALALLVLSIVDLVERRRTSSPTSSVENELGGYMTVYADSCMTFIDAGNILNDECSVLFVRLGVEIEPDFAVEPIGQEGNVAWTLGGWLPEHSRLSTVVPRASVFYSRDSLDYSDGDIFAMRILRLSLSEWTDYRESWTQFVDSAAGSLIRAFPDEEYRYVSAVDRNPQLSRFDHVLHSIIEDDNGDAVISYRTCALVDSLDVAIIEFYALPISLPEFWEIEERVLSSFRLGE